ncbi:MAG TPA: isoprenylcysteine carboxylmethyltransferase family protein [Pyrinomonadaceae bacterium]|nr:isoprenylcysteine carboxylmethyltransferase family protein [Pyrinomonadaceae bacterium]
MFVLVRAATYSALFIGFLLVFLPQRLLSWSGLTPTAGIGTTQVLGIISSALGGALAVWCILTFVFVGKGTPAPFDPPRKLVVRGPYKFLRNPMYVGAALALVGAALYYWSFPLFSYAVLFLLAMHAFVVFYEEPTLRRNFGDDYADYYAQVGCWWPKI